MLTEYKFKHTFEAPKWTSSERTWVCDLYIRVYIMDENIDLGNINLIVVTEVIKVEEVSLRHFITKKREMSKVMTWEIPILKMQRGRKYTKETEEHPEKKEGDQKRMLSRKTGV